MEPAPSLKFWRYLLSGAIAGAGSALSFGLIHAIFISNIWFFVVPMLGAGALCGLSLAGSYALTVARPSISGWILYNALYIAMLGLLGLASVAIFDPITTIATLLKTNGPPTQLFQQALPMTAFFTLASSLTFGLLYRPNWRGWGAIALANILLVFFLGLNVSVIGLVDIPRSFLYLVFELVGLILSLGVVYVVFFVVLEWKSLTRPK